MERTQAQRDWYKNYYAKLGADRNDIRLNPGVLFQTLAAEQAFVQAVRKVFHNYAKAKVLDVGCGSGGDLFHLIRTGYSLENITGVDIQEDRLIEGRRNYPTVNFINADAAHLAMPSGSFDLVFESTMFATLPDKVVSAQIANEMLRVCRPNGYIVLLDWRTPKWGDSNYEALTKARLIKLFAVGTQTRLICSCHGALIPPIGRFLSANLPAVYFLVSRLFPVLVGQVVYLLQKSPHLANAERNAFAVYVHSGGGRCSGVGRRVSL